MTDTDFGGFATATAIHALGDGTYSADLDPQWAVGDHPHGGYLLALLTRAATDAVGDAQSEPLSVSAQFLRSPKIGPVVLRTEPLKRGRTVTFVRATLEQGERTQVEATVTLGALPAETPAWSDLPDMPVEPPAEAVDMGRSNHEQFSALSRSCDLRLDPEGAGFLKGSTTGPLRLRLWVRPREAQPDLLFGLVAGDITMPVTLNLGRFGWSPTVQLTALLRARPASGWLRLAVESKAVHGAWFDEDTLVIDSTGRLICQARQLALSPSAE
ncbi:thioesterase family protein [Haloactinomyces albus]|uniref:Acyl-CoA thioesterase n=1 Tax=Haloactinomyces albus TaxID=1352928 RepID=A0AAE4CMF4_9ACTN|nr:thioesterase family protein [Haloactinomyces albus]MDR7302351.1 acyl-CoA thioesterase [Haloactinomyces albus]